MLKLITSILEILTRLVGPFLAYKWASEKKEAEKAKENEKLAKEDAAAWANSRYRDTVGVLRDAAKKMRKDNS